MFRNLRIYLTILAIIAIAVVLILNKFLVYGLILFGIAVLLFWLWQLLIKKKDDEITKLKAEKNESTRQLESLKEENNELRSRKLNISEIRNILDLGLIEINTNFTRTWNDKFKHKDTSVHFIGALKISIIAKFGIDLKELRIKYDKVNNVIFVANINPKFLSFSSLDYDWTISEILEYKKPFLGSDHWRVSSELQGLGSNIKEDLRKRVNEEIKNGPEELVWIINPLRKQIENILGKLLGSQGRKMIFVDTFDNTFKKLEEVDEHNDDADLKQ